MCNYEYEKYAGMEMCEMKNAKKFFYSQNVIIKKETKF